MSKKSTDLSPVQTLLLGSLAVIALLGAFGLSFWAVSRGAGLDWHNRAQSQIRSPEEELAANKNWDPNRLLGNFNHQMPEADSWGENFGKPLAYTKGVDADTYLYPKGMAPAPGSLILGEGDEILEGEDGTFLQDENNPDPTMQDNTNSDFAPTKTRDGSFLSNPSNSPVGNLLNR